MKRENLKKKNGGFGKKMGEEKKKWRKKVCVFKNNPMWIKRKEKQKTEKQNQTWLRGTLVGNLR